MRWSLTGSTRSTDGLLVDLACRAAALPKLGAAPGVALGTLLGWLEILASGAVVESALSELNTLLGSTDLSLLSTSALISFFALVEAAENCGSVPSALACSNCAGPTQLAMVWPAGNERPAPPVIYPLQHPGTGCPRPPQHRQELRYLFR